LCRFAFPKADRILKRRSFVRLAETGETTQNRHFILVHEPSRRRRSRLGITVTRSVGPAVVRNRIKRHTREFFRLNRHSFAGFWDINLIAKREAASLSSEQVLDSLRDIFGKLPR